MIPQFVLDNVFTHIPGDDTREEVYYAKTREEDGWVLYWPEGGDTFHTYRDPADWY